MVTIGKKVAVQAAAAGFPLDGRSQGRLGAGRSVSGHRHLHWSLLSSIDAKGSRRRASSFSRLPAI